MKRFLIWAVLLATGIGTSWLVGQEPAARARNRAGQVASPATGERTSRTNSTARVGDAQPVTVLRPLQGLQPMTTNNLVTETISGSSLGQTVVGQVFNVGSTLSEEQLEELSELRDIVHRLRSEDNSTEESRVDLRRQAKEILSKQIDRDVQQRQTKLAEIERRATELRRQLEARQANKEKTVEMLLMLAENPGAGLGIPNEWLQSLMQNQGTVRYYNSELPVQRMESARGLGASAGSTTRDSELETSREELPPARDQ